MWSQTYSFKVVFSLDLLGATLFFGVFSLSISTMAGLVRDGKDAPLKLYDFQRSFLRWLEPRLSREHCAKALQSDIARAKQALTLMGVQL